MAELAEVVERDMLILAEDRFFDPDPQVRRIARSLHEETSALPLICPHGHVDAQILADNTPFPEPAALIITPDHYIFRMLYSRGIPLERLGIPGRGDSEVERDPRRIWQLFADHYYLFRGTPTGIWLDYELAEVFGIRRRLNSESARAIYDELSERLRQPEFLPRALFDRFNIEVLATTDKATDSLAAHRAIKAAAWNGRVIPTFRPDALFRIATPQWPDELAALEQTAGQRYLRLRQIRGCATGTALVLQAPGRDGDRSCRGRAVCGTAAAG